MQPASIPIKHRCSEITFTLLTIPYCITCLLEVRILYATQKLHGYFHLRIVTEFEDEWKTAS